MVLALRVAVFFFLLLRVVGGVELALISPDRVFAILALAVASAYGASFWGILKREIWGYYFALVLIGLDLAGALLALFFKPALAGVVAVAAVFDLAFLFAVLYLMRVEVKGEGLRG